MNREVERVKHVAGPVLGLATAIGLALLLGLLWPPAAVAHGVNLSAGRGPAAWVLAQYSDGEPMSYAKIRIITPQGQTHQVGNADASGRFCWLPGQAGQWTMVVEDGQGHRGEASLAWQDNNDAPVATVQGGGPLAGQPVWARAVWGLSALFGLSGLWFWRMGLRAARRGAKG